MTFKLNQLLLSICSIFGLSVFAIPSAHAIMYRHDIPESNYFAADVDYPALVDLIYRGDCIGTLVHPRFLLTVAHCAADVSKKKPLTVHGTPYEIAELILHPQWKDDENDSGDPAAYDIALIRLKKPVVGVAPFPIYRKTNELGAILTIVGRGMSATGLVGENGGKDDGKLRRATNRVSGVNQHSLQVYFESPNEPGVLPLEGVGAAGDSGCPAFLTEDGMTYVAGLNSGGLGDEKKNIGIGQYGSRDFQSRVSQHLPWLDRYLPKDDLHF